MDKKQNSRSCYIYGYFQKINQPN